MTIENFITRVNELDLTSSTKIKIKKFWDGQPYYYYVGGAGMEDGNLVFNAMKNDYSSIDLEKLFEDLKEQSNDGMVRVGSFRVHYIQPTMEGFSLVINTNRKKVSKLQKVFNYNIF
jgi:hypothetical protein|tara:strand:- start:309 stop:659 length:351 start_codon:yes stop_codon:yes gene_type:complete